jgi:hypothetical protein
VRSLKGLGGMWLDKCWALRGHAIVWFASATFNGLLPGPDKLPICPMFWIHCRPKNWKRRAVWTLDGGILLDQQSRLAEQCFWARAFMFLGAATPSRAMPYPVFTPHRGPNSTWRSAFRRRPKKSDIWFGNHPEKQTSQGRAVPVR